MKVIDNIVLNIDTASIVSIAVYHRLEHGRGVLSCWGFLVGIEAILEF